METLVLNVDAVNPSTEAIHRAADVIRSGGLVAFPTETVYGLGANALDAAAVARIFEAKGRPATNPVIVHVADASEVVWITSQWPASAAKLAERFWPGPLTLVVPKGDSVPSIVTAGGLTVAVRCPNHAVARALIRAAGVPIAAPSANRSTELSPTRAEHVLKSLNSRIDLVLDGGPCTGGIESTVVDVTGEVPRVLRPGLITVPMLEEVCGRVEIGAQEGDKGEPKVPPINQEEGISRSPGQMAKHYSPRAEVELCEDLVEMLDAAYWLPTTFGHRVGVIERGESERQSTEWVIWRCLPNSPEGYAARLYDVLHELDETGVGKILIELPPDIQEWAAIRDRLTRAAAK